MGVSRKPPISDQTDGVSMTHLMPEIYAIGELFSTNGIIVLLAVVVATFFIVVLVSLLKGQNSSIRLNFLKFLVIDIKKEKSSK
jgi:hypothetical protein